MISDKDIGSQIEAYLTEILINLEKDKFLLPTNIKRSSYERFYSSFSKLRNILSEHNVMNHLINALKEIQPVVITDFIIYPLLYQKMCGYSSWASIKSTKSNIDIKPVPSNINHIYMQSLNCGINECNSVYGTYFLMENCDIRFLSTVGCIANRILPEAMESFSLSTTPSQDVQIPIQSVVSIIGKSVFLGLLYPSLDWFDFQIDFLMAITDENGSHTVASLFYDVIDFHLNLISKTMDVIVLNLMIPDIGPTSTNTDPKYLLWTYQDWKNEELKPKDVITKLTEVYLNYKKEQSNSIPFIVIQMMIAIHGDTHRSGNEASNNYHKIRIKYVPHTLQIAGNGNTGEIWSCYGHRKEELNNLIVESIFVKEAHVDAIMTLVLNQSLCFNANNTGNINGATNNRRLYLHFKSDGDVNKSMKEIKSVLGVFKFPDNSATAVTNVEKLVPSSLDAYSNIWKDNLAITEKHWTEIIVKSHSFMDFFIILENILKLVVAQSSIIPSNIDRSMLYCELQIILQSPIYKLYNIIQTNITLRELMYSFNEHGQRALVLNTFHNLIDDMSNVLASIGSRQSMSCVKGLLQKLSSRSSEIVFSGIVNTDIKEMLKPKMMLELRYWNNLLYPLLWQMIGDCLYNCTNLERLIKELHNLFPALSTKTEVLVKDTEFKNEVDFQRFSVLNVPKSEFPAMDIVTYLQTMDFHIYWKRYLVAILNDIDNLRTVDSFAMLCDQFNRASLKFDLDLLRRNKGVDDYSTFMSECVDADNFIYKSTNYEAYGLRSSLMLFDSTKFADLAIILSAVDHKVYDKSNGLFEVTIATGLLGQLPYYGKIDPWVRVMDVVDHIYVTGPDGCLEEASQVFAQTVIKHVLNYKSVLPENSVIMGLFSPEFNQAWRVDELSQISREVIIQIANNVRQSCTVHTRILIPHQWRYLSVVKHFRFHFMNFKKNQYFTSVANDKSSLEAFRFLFFNKESAQTYFTKGGYFSIAENPFTPNNLVAVNQKLDQIVKQKYNSQAWIGLYRAIVTKSMISDNFDLVRESSKIFHGTLGSLDFVNTLNKTMQFVIFSIMETKSFSLESNTVDTVSGNAKVAVKAKSKQKVGPVKKTLSIDILNKMFRGYYVLLVKIFENNNMAHLHLKEIILLLLNQIAQTNGQKDICISLTSGSIIKLEQIRQMLEFMECLYGWNSPESCPKSFSYIQSIDPQLSNVSVNMHDSLDQYNEILTLNMIKSDNYQLWSTKPNYGLNF